jgi:cellulose synthase/poly-beta-1,6-N-acetylglucosamine synthase-like glycosyltransferase
VGEARSCGGDALFRVEALRQAGGYSPTMIAGEEPDMCLRMRGKGWAIRRIDAEMTIHDADIRHFGQWWKRTQRAGHAFAELTYRHGRQSDSHWSRQVASILFWSGLLGIGLVLTAVGLLAAAEWALLLGGSAILLVLAQILRLVLLQWSRGTAFRAAVPSGVLLMVGKIPQLQGLVQFLGRRADSARLRLIEYKS